MKREVLAVSAKIDKEAPQDYSDYMKEDCLIKLGTEYARKYSKETVRHWYHRIGDERTFLSKRDDKFMEDRGYTFDFKEIIYTIVPE